MAIEIERKFLVDTNTLETPNNGIRIKQGYIAKNDLAVVRVRIKGDKGYITVKGASFGISCKEFEYEIPLEDAEEMLLELCGGKVIEKTRYQLKWQQHTWELDVFHGANEGLVVAEIELSSEGESFALPDWATIEVTGETKYYNAKLIDFPYSQWHKM